MVFAALVVAALVAVGLVVARASDHTAVVTGPGEGAGPPPGPNAQLPSLTVEGGGGALSRWEAARTGVDDRQLLISFYPRSPLTCPHVERVDVTSDVDTVTVGLYLSDDPDPGCGTALAVVQLPEPLGGRTLTDQADPAGTREVLDGARLQVPAFVPHGAALFDERLLVNNDRLGGWYQSYEMDGRGSLRIAQGSRRSEVLGAVGLGPAGPGGAPVALNATKPLNTSTLDIDGRAVTAVVYSVGPEDQPAEIMMLWDEGQTAFAVNGSSVDGSLTVDDLAAVVRSMHTG